MYPLLKEIAAKEKVFVGERFTNPEIKYDATNPNSYIVLEMWIHQGPHRGSVRTVNACHTFRAREGLDSVHGL